MRRRNGSVDRVIRRPACSCRLLYTSNTDEVFTSMSFILSSSMSAVFLWFTVLVFSLSYCLSCVESGSLGDLLVPFVALHVLIVSVILVIAGRSLVYELCSPW